MVKKVEMTTRLLFICILSFLTCSHASRSRGPFGFRNSPSIEVSSFKSPRLSPFRHSISGNTQAALQIRAGDPNTKAVSTNEDDDEKKSDVILESESVVETTANNVTTAEKEEDEIANVQQEIVEIEDSDLDTDDEMAEAIDLASDDEEEEDFYTDSEDSESDYAEDIEIDDVEDEHPNMEVVVETAVKVSKRAGILALKFSKVAAYWVRQWSWDIYRACERAVDACREELVEGGEETKLTKVELKDATRLQIFRNKSWSLTKRTCKTIYKMTVAFWTMDDNDILPDYDDSDSILPKFSFLDKLKLRRDVEEEDSEDEDYEENIEPEEEEESFKPKSSLRKKLRTKRIKKKKATASPTSTTAPKDEEKAVVTIIPRVRNARRVIIGLVVGIVFRCMWEELGATALIVKGLSGLPPKFKPWSKTPPLANSEESE